MSAYITSRLRFLFYLFFPLSPFYTHTHTHHGRLLTGAVLDGKFFYTLKVIFTQLVLCIDR